MTTPSKQPQTGKEVPQKTPDLLNLFTSVVTDHSLALFHQSVLPASSISPSLCTSTLPIQLTTPFYVEYTCSREACEHFHNFSYVPFLHNPFCLSFHPLHILGLFLPFVSKYLPALAFNFFIIITFFLCYWFFITYPYTHFRSSIIISLRLLTLTASSSLSHF